MARDFIVESWMTVDQLLSLGSTYADVSKHTHRHPPASLPLSDIRWFSVGYAIPAIATFLLLRKATSPSATIAALADSRSSARAVRGGAG